MKYLVVRQTVLKNSELDEPVDLMLYMIIAGLGFAALENILLLVPTLGFGKVAALSFFRFIGATFLHALASGTLGYFLALSIYQTKKRTRLIVLGIAIATLLHGLYNFAIIKTTDNQDFIYIPIILLTALAFLVTSGFKKLKKIKSVCKIH